MHSHKKGMSSEPLNEASLNHLKQKENDQINPAEVKRDKEDAQNDQKRDDE